jgi:hypothetical protein
MGSKKFFTARLTCGKRSVVSENSVSTQMNKPGWIRDKTGAVPVEGLNASELNRRLLCCHERAERVKTNDRLKPSQLSNASIRFFGPLRATSAKVLQKPAFRQMISSPLLKLFVKFV